MIDEQKNLEKIKKIETKISRNLYLICVLVTLVTMVLTAVEFFSKGRFFPARINFFYLGVLLIYSLHKELIRWLGERKRERHGEYFVYLWVGLTTVLYIINFLTHEYFSYSIEGYRLGTLRDISILTLEVLGVFILTRLLKILELFLKNSKS